MKKSRIWTLFAAFTLLVGIGPQGCANEDDNGGPSAEADAGTAGDVTDARPRPDVVDTGGGEDAPEPDVSPPDVSPPDLSEPDVVQTDCGALWEDCCSGETCDGELVCSRGTCAPPSSCPGTPGCLEPDPGTPDVPISTLTGYPPDLAGGVIPSGPFELNLIEIYPDETFSSIVEAVVISSNGNSYGSMLIHGDDFGFAANMDLFISVTAMGMPFDQYFQQALYAGGCGTSVGNQLRSDLTGCGSTWPEGSEPPDYLEYEVGEEELRFLMILTNEAILASVPEQDRFLAGLAITGDLPIVFTFTPDW